jgi:glycosyltransferase involved in cell wall biosynthesis
MRLIFLVTRADTIAGNQVYILELAKMLRTHGHEILVVTGAPGIFTAALQQLALPYRICWSLQRAINPLQDVTALMALQKILREFQPNLVSAHSSKAGILGRLASKLYGVPCIFTAHGWAFTEGVPQPLRNIYRFLEKTLAPLASQIICVSEHDRQLGVQAGMDAQKLVTIRNGMPDIPISSRAQAGEGQPVRIATIARFDSQKDYATLLKACQPLTNVQLDLVGDGAQLAAMQDLAKNLGMSDRVNFLGFRSDVSSILAQAHIFTLISNWEGFPITTIEAMRAGLPVVVSDVGGAAEAVLEGQTGYGVARGDVSTLQQRLAALAADPSLRQSMGQAARQRYEAEFTFEQMFQQTLVVYEKAASSRLVPTSKPST